MDDQHDEPGALAVTRAAADLFLVQGVLAEVEGGRAPECAEVLAALAVLRQLREEVASWEHRLIEAARAGGASWVDLAPCLGVTSRQAAERRYLRLRPSSSGEHTTGEARVRAERDRRAGDRAVQAWARRNSGVLRRLAGQIGALEGLSGPAQRYVERVGRALADDDPAGLLSPLADAQSHLRQSHQGLAEQVRSVTEHTEQLRRDAQDARLGLAGAAPEGRVGPPQRGHRQPPADGQSAEGDREHGVHDGH